MPLTTDQINQFTDKGYLIIPNWITDSQVLKLKNKADLLLTKLDLCSHPRTVFRTSKEQVNNLDYFLDSHNKIHYFFEEKAFDENGQLIYPPQTAINKIGHGLHLLDDDYKNLTFSDQVSSIAMCLGYKKPIVLQSMLIFKHPLIGGEVNKHRDNTFIYTEPTSSIGFWLALEDCHISNGCLSFVPGSHTDQMNTKRWIKNDSGNGQINMEFIGEDKIVYGDNAFVNAEVKKGSLILIHGEVVHMSLSNQSNQSRFAYTFHIIESDNTSYPKTNWLEMTDDLKPLYIIN